MNNDTPADAIKPCRYCGGQKRFQIVSPVSDHAWADCFCVKDRTPSLAAQDGLVASLRKQLEDAREALRFYANLPCNLEFGVVNECPYDDGATAREALKGKS